jgi:hypothetical protein
MEERLELGREELGIEEEKLERSSGFISTAGEVFEDQDELISSSSP